MASSTKNKKSNLTKEEWQIIAVARECHLYKKELLKEKELNGEETNA